MNGQPRGLGRLPWIDTRCRAIWIAGRVLFRHEQPKEPSVRGDARPDQQEAVAGEKHSELRTLCCAFPANNSNPLFVFDKALLFRRSVNDLTVWQCSP